MMKKKVMPLSCLMAAAMLAGCGTAAPAVSEKTTAPAAETAEAAQKTAPADAAESEAAAMEETAGMWKVEPCYNFDEIVPLYSEWDHTAGKNAADGLYAVRDGERWSLFSAKTGNIMMQDAAQQMPYLYGTNELSVWLDDEYYNYDNFAAMREKCEGLNAELQANDAEIEVLYDGVGGYANRWIYTEDSQIYYDLLGTYEFSGTPLAQVSAAPDTPSVDTPSTDNKAAETPAAAGAPSAAAAVSTAPVDTRTAQQREIDEAKANGTWGIEYTTCQKCGYHNWTRKGNVYVCDTCGNETTTVVSAKGVKGYVGSGAIAPVANKAAAPETRYANAKQAQAAADAREAAYAAAVAAFQKQIAANEAAYLAAIAK